MTRMSVYRRAASTCATPRCREHVGNQNKFMETPSRGRRGRLARAPTLPLPTSGGGWGRGGGTPVVPREGRFHRFWSPAVYRVAIQFLPFGGRSLDIGMRKKPNPARRHD